jgi:MFS family permease
MVHAFPHLYQVALLPLYFLIVRDRHFGLNNVEQATFLVTVLMLSYFIPAYPVGILADRFSKRKLLSLGLGLNAAGYVGLAFSQNYSQALACMVISGIGGSAYHPAASALIARFYPEATGRAFGLLGIGASAGFFVGPAYAGWRGMISGWRAPVLELGMAGLIAALAFYFFADEEPAHEQPKNRPVHHDKLFPISSLWIFFLAAAFAFSLRDFTGSSMGSLGSLFLQKAHRLNPSATGWILSTIFVASAISNPLFGRLSDRGLIKWMLVALGTAALVVFGFPHVPVRFSAIVLAVYGFFFMASYPMVEGALMASMPHHVRGRIFGIFITVGGIVGNLAHWMMGAYVKHLGPAATRVESYYGVYAILACLLLLALLGLPCLLKVAKSGVQRSEIAPVFATLKD